MLKTGLLLYVILLMLLPRAHGQSHSNTWSEVKAYGGGTLVIAYSENSPFIYNNEQGILAGIEFEIMEEFVRLLTKIMVSNSIWNMSICIILKASLIP